MPHHRQWPGLDATVRTLFLLPSSAGESGGRQEHHMVRVFDRQTQRSHVLQRLVKETVEFLVARLDLDHGLELFRHRQEKAGLVAFPDTIVRRAKLLLAILEHIQADVPSLAGLKRNLEAEPSIGGNGLARCTRHGDCHRAVKIPVRIRGTKPLPSLRPFCGDLAAASSVPYCVPFFER
jgi:hypothetical protein